MRRLLTLSAVLLTTAAPALAQGGMTMAAPAGGRMSVAPSARGRAVMDISTGVRGAAPLKVTIDYGQPFARGRAVEGGLIPNGEVWRTGANSATSLTTDVTLRIGTLTVPKGSYTLFTLWTPAAGMQLIVNKQTGQWGTEYKPDMDLGRAPMTAKTLADARDAFTIVLEPTPATAGPAAGVLRLTWGRTEFSVPVTAVP
ncbi:MAG: DUF2911 domain-containing protein [Gemmatimonadaceae bacterium]|nr:DUF2911 domain-containing protein [Gemmatimonadaceae bacterium]